MLFRSPFQPSLLRVCSIALSLFGSHQLRCENNVHYLFSHGMLDDATQAIRYIELESDQKRIRDEGPIILNKPYTAFNYPDATARIWRANLAQEKDIEALAHAYQELVDEPENIEALVLFGVSRGASTALGFLANTKPTDIRAVVLESPFDSVDALLSRQADRIFRQPRQELVTNLHKHLVPAILRRYRPDGPTPVSMVSEIDAALPILVICSVKDGIVPVESSIAVYKKLRETGHKNAHLLVLEQGEHARIKRNSPEGEKFQNVVHAFYKKYNLPHNHEWAQTGLKSFEQTQPTTP